MAVPFGPGGSAAPRLAARLGLALILLAPPGPLRPAGPPALALLPAARAQISPNCLRNGRREACAYTPLPAQPGAVAGEALERGALVFADHTIYEVQRLLGSCRERGPITSCRARILQPPGNRDGALAAWYRGTAHEGGYRHEYGARGLRLSYSWLD